jgi:hypothetical protein
MTEPNRQYAYLSFTGSFNPADITARLGITPTESWRQGEINPHNQRERRSNAWHLRSRLPEDEELEAHIADLFDQTAHLTDTIAELACDHNGCMQLVGCFYGEYPGLYFESNIVAELSRRKLSVDFDFYGLYSHRRENTS